MMNMQPKITGKNISYRPMIEAELSAVERDKAYDNQARASKAVRLTRQQARAASMDLVESKPEYAKWYCLQVRTNQDTVVEKHLSDANVDVYAARERCVYVRRGKKVEATRAFFPGYLLVRIVPSGYAFDALLAHEQVIDFVGDSAGYHVVRNEDVQRFKAHATEEVPRVKCDKTFEDGDEALVRDGPFTGFVCVLVSVKYNRQPRARVLIKLRGRQFEIDSMPLAFLEKL